MLFRFNFVLDLCCFECSGCNFLGFVLYFFCSFFFLSDRRDRMVVGFTTTFQSVPITTKVMSSNPFHSEMYSIQQYVIKFVGDLRQVCGFSPGTQVSSINKTDSHDIAEILLKVALNTIAHYYFTLYFST